MMELEATAECTVHWQFLVRLAQQKELPLA